MHRSEGGTANGLNLDVAVKGDYDSNMTDQSSPAGDAMEGSPDLTVDAAIVSPPRIDRRARWATKVFGLTLGMCAVLALFAHRYAYFGWDLALARSIQSITIPGFDGLMVAVSLLGNGLIGWPLVAAAGLAMIIAGLKAEGVICIAGPALGSTANLLFKAVVGRPRPTELLVRVADVYSHESFPSGHVFFFVEFFGFLFLLVYVLLERGALRLAALVLLGLLIALIGVSRVYLGAHWPSDVAGAYLAGGVWLMVMIAVYERVNAKGRNQ